MGTWERPEEASMGRTTGVVRRIDELGRVVVPSEVRRVIRLREGDELEISVDGERIILQKRQDVCLFCSAEHPELEFKQRRICHGCASEFLQQAPSWRVP
jgi:AbrB family transcriptional regulator, transcriptional pleiotropic regulator of transition state genes